MNENKEICYLPAKQSEVLKLLALGLRNKEIAFKMNKSVSTVKQHVSGLMRRLNVTTRTAIVVKAQKLGLIDDKEEKAPDHSAE